jgi:hypothetical protein
MRVEVIAPDAVLATGEARFFVLHLGPDDGGYADGYHYEVQVCDEELRAAVCVLFRGDESELTVLGYDVPEVVFSAARRQEPGRGDFVDIWGETVWPLW